MLEIDPTELGRVLLLESFIEGGWQHHPEHIRKKWLWLLDFLLHQLFEQCAQGICLDITGGKTVIFGELMDESPDLLGHEHTLYERVDIASVPHIFQSSIPKTHLPFLPILLLLILRGQVPNRQSLEDLMKS